MRRHSVRSQAQFIATIIAVGVVYFLAGKLGLRLAFLNASATAVWPPTGIALTALLIFGRRLWPVVFVGAFLVNYTTAGSLLTSLGIAAGNTLEAVIAAFLIRKFARGRDAFEHVQSTVLYVFFVMVATTISATIGVSTLVLSGLAEWGQAFPIWLTWWLGDTVGGLIVAPLLLLWSSNRFHTLQIKRALEFGMVLVVTGFTGLLVFGGTLLPAAQHLPVEFLCAPPLIWCAYRFRQRETISAIMLLSALAIMGTLQGYGPFFVDSANSSLVLLQAFLGITSITMMMLCTATVQSARAQEEQEELGAIVSSSHDAIIGLDTRDRIMSWNAAAERLYGYSALDVIGKNIALIAPPQEVGEFTALHERIQRGDQLEHVETKRRRKDGSILDVSLSVSPIRDLRGDIVGFSTITHDISQRKRLEETKTEFISLAAHQLKTPVAEMEGLVKNLLDGIGGTPTPQQQSYLLTLEKIIGHSGRLVSDLLDVSRIDRGVIRMSIMPVNLGHLLKEILQIHHHAAQQKNLHFVLKEQQPNIMVMVDAEKFSQAIGNILENAIKVTESGNIVIHASKDASKAYVEVNDTGMGIDPDDMQVLFAKDQIMSGKPIAGGGAGLGLYIAKKFMVAQHGDVTATSSKGKGTTFVFSIPLSSLR